MKVRTIRDYAQAFSGYAFSANDLVDVGHPVLKIGNIQNYHIEKETESFYNGEITEKIRKYQLQKDDFLIAMTGAGSVGRAGKMIDFEEGYLVNQRVAIIRPYIEKTDSRYLFYYFSMNYVEKYLYNLGIGAGQPNISANDILKTKVLFPELDKQRKIGEILSAYDELIENNNKRIKILEQMAENLYKEWFVRFRFPGYEKVALKKQTPSGWLLSTKTSNMDCPENWDYGNFSNYGSFVRGKNITAAEMIDGDIPVVSAGIEPSGYHNKQNVKGNSLTISASGANAGYLKYHLSDIWAADCSYFQDDKKLWFVYNALKFLQPVISNLQVGAAQPHVYPKNINKLCTIIADAKTIEAYCDKVKPIYEQIGLLKQKNENLTKQRDMLLPRLMSGKLEA